MNTRAERDVGEFELVVLSVYRQVGATEVAAYDNGNEVTETITNSSRDTQTAFFRRDNPVGLEGHLTGTDTEKQPPRVHFLAGALPRSQPRCHARDERQNDCSDSCNRGRCHCRRCSRWSLT